MSSITSTPTQTAPTGDPVPSGSPVLSLEQRVSALEEKIQRAENGLLAAAKFLHEDSKGKMLVAMMPKAIQERLGEFFNGNR
jgi:hypothetical protein